VSASELEELVRVSQKNLCECARRVHTRVC